MSHKPTSHEILEDPDFKELARQKTLISTILTLLTMAAYFAFMFLIAYRKEALAGPIANGTWGIPIGIGVIILAWIFTGIYVYWANTKYDVLIEKVKQKIGEA